MKATKEQFQFPEEFPFLMFQTSGKQEVVHSHDCLEVNVVETGSGYYLIDGHKYPIRPGDFFIINNMEKHMAVHDSDFLITVLLFDVEFIWKIFREHDYLKPFFARSESFCNRICCETPEYEKMLSFLRMIAQEYEKQETGWQILIETNIVSFLLFVYRYYEQKQELAEESSVFLGKYERIATVLEYIDQHYQEDMSLDEMAQQISVSRNYLCRCFKEVTNWTVFEYIEQVRMQSCSYLLLHTDLPITRIAEECGFRSMTYFNRCFKKNFQKTPREYRKRES